MDEQAAPAQAGSPAVRRRRLALELRRLREKRGLTCEEVARRLECSASKISRIETGRVSASPRDVRDLLGIYDVAPSQREALVQLARESRQKGWWTAYSDSVKPALANYLGLETAASQILVYQMHRIPGLLQTEEYARAAFAADPLCVAGSAEQEAALLMERRRQAEANPPIVSAVLDEGALRRQVGGPAVLRGQIEYLLELTALACLALQVIPFRRGATVLVDLPFMIMSFADQGDPGVVCMRYPTGLLWLEDPAEVRLYEGFFAQLQAAGLAPEQSADLMRSVLADL